MRSAKLSIFVAAAAMAIAVAVGACTSAPSSSSSSTSSAAPSSSSPSGAAPRGLGSGGAGSNARSGPAEGGTAGTVSSSSTSSFTVTTAAGQAVMVNEGSSTTYQSGTSSTSPTAITTGQTVLVLGMTNGTTITATQVIVQPAGEYGTSASTAAGVVPFQQGAPSTSKQVGQIPNYTEGQGTIVDGTTADQATEAALAAYPGGVVDRVVQLSGGEYEVHNIGVNWPHHVFVDQAFKVLGAN
jgi:ABC-type Fe3+-hydroxamate transport system substrate-binding protein